MNTCKTYLGDGVYAMLDYGDIRLTTENGYTTTNVIVLEPAVFGALLRFVETEKIK